MKTFQYDAINPFTGEMFSWEGPNIVWGEPSYYLEPGDEGFVPYPNQVPDPAWDSVHRGPMLLEDLIKNSPSAGERHRSLSTFQYDIVRRTDGGFSTLPVAVRDLDGDTIDADVAAATGIPEEKCAAVLAAYMDQLFMCAAGNRWAHAIHNLLSMLPDSAGTSRVPDGFRTVG